MTLAPEPVPPTSELRSRVFSYSPEQIGLQESQTGSVWALIMETGYAEAVVSLVVIADGTISLYFGSGGGVIGAGEHQPVLDAAGVLLHGANIELPKLLAVAAPSLPRVGEVKFYARTYKGLFMAACPEEELATGAHPLWQLYGAAQDVITAIRENTPT